MKQQTMHRKVFYGLTAALSLSWVLVLPNRPSGHSLVLHRQASRGLAMAFGQYANLPSSVNVASVLNTFQTPSTLLPLTNMASQIQAQMQAGIPAGTPVWDGHGQLPGAVGTAGFNPTFQFDASGCNIVPMNFSSLYSPSMELPTVWCGAVAQGQTKATASLDGIGSGAGTLDGSHRSRAVQLQ